MAESEITNFYKNRSVFITGATGFLGKAIVEKLLRACPLITNIYVLIRTKRNEDVGFRLQKLLDSSLYDTLRAVNPAVLSKIVAISGDITLPNLGMSTGDLAQISREVSVVIHTAATVKFDEELRLALKVNLGATKVLVDLCKTFTKFAAFVHISTAYSNCDLKNIDERVYETTVNPNNLLQGLSWIDEAMLKSITPKLLGNYPNTYTFTKALAERLVNEERGSLPMCIIRPSIITATYAEPVPGWVDNLNGLSGNIVAYAKGMLHTALLDSEKVADYVPLDFCVNLILASAWETANARTKEMVVYNCCSGQLNPVRWGAFESIICPIMKMYPLNEVVWYPFVAFTSNSLWNSIRDFFLHYLPACAADTICRITGRKAIMLKIYRKLFGVNSLLSFFTTREWNFSTQNTTNLFKKLSFEDQKLFNFNVQIIDWPKYLEDHCRGVRKYLLKEECSTLPVARTRLQKLYWLHTFTKLLVFFLVGVPSVLLSIHFQIFTIV